MPSVCPTSTSSHTAEHDTWLFCTRFTCETAKKWQVARGIKRKVQCAGGDAFLSRCIWKAGYAFTDPGYSFYHWEAKSFDPGPESSRQLVQDLRIALLGACPPESLVRFPALGNADQSPQ